MLLETMEEKPMNRQANQAKFQKTIKEGLQKLGAKENKENNYKFVLLTDFGRLFLTYHESDVKDNSKVYSLYTRFEIPEKAKNIPFCNPYSGKWNFHFNVSEMQPEDIAKAILKVIRTTLRLIPVNCPCHNMIEAQKAKLKKALEEHKWYESEKAGHDVGDSFAKMNFIEIIMPGWGKRFRNNFCRDCENNS
jgi:hypothetical protein